MIWDNILRRLIAVECLHKHLRARRGLSNTDKSSYYRSIFIILCTVAEGLVYEIAKANTTAPTHFFDKQARYSDVCTIPQSVLGTSSDVRLFRKERVDMSINDEGATFGRLNLFLRHKRLITEKQYNTLDWVRKERNKLHIQGLTDLDTDYTDKKVKRVSKAIKILIGKTSPR